MFFPSSPFFIDPFFTCRNNNTAVRDNQRIYAQLSSALQLHHVVAQEYSRVLLRCFNSEQGRGAGNTISSCEIRETCAAPESLSLEYNSTQGRSENRVDELALLAVLEHLKRSNSFFTSILNALWKSCVNI